MEKQSGDEKFLGRTGLRWFLAFISFIGAVIFGVGLIESLNKWQNVFFSVGGTIFGSALGTTLGLIAGGKLQRQVENVQDGVAVLSQSIRKDSEKLYQQLSDTLSHAVDFPWATDEAILKPKRTRHYIYYRTRIQGEEFWMYLPLEFSQLFEPGRLFCKAVIPMMGKEYRYEHNGFLIGNSLVLNVKSVHGEAEGFVIIRDFGRGLAVRGYWGLYVHLDWDGNDGVDPCILAEAQFENTGDPGRQTPEFGRKIEEIWSNLAPKLAQAVGRSL